LGKLDELTAQFNKEELEDYDAGYEAGKQKANEIIREVESILYNEKQNFKEGYWDAIIDHLYFV
jgi:hypothetical protein